MRTPSRVPRILLTLFAIAVGAILTGLYTLLGTHGEESLFDTYAVGGLVGGGVGALWSLLMSRLPPNASAGRILLRGIGLGAVAGPVAVLLVPAIWLIGHNTRIDGNPFTYAMGMIFLSEFFAIPTGLAAGLVCSLLAWYIAARERKKALSPCATQGENARIPNRPRLPRIVKTLVILLGVLGGAAPSTYLVLSFVSYFKLEHPVLICLSGVLAGSAAGAATAILWLIIMAKLCPDTDSARLVLVGGLLGAVLGVFTGAVFVPIWAITNGVGEILWFLPPVILGGGAYVGLHVGLVWAAILCFSKSREVHRLAKQGIQTLPQTSQTEAPLHPPAPAPPEKSGI